MEFIKAKLVGYTQPSEEFKDSFKDMKELVAFCSRVSNPANQYNNETADKLIKYLIRNKHWSPMELATATLEIECPRDISRQLLRHRSFSANEFSQRYASPTEDMQFIIREARLQDSKNRQNSVETSDKELQDLWEEKQRDVILAAKQVYEWAVSNGIAKEQARCVLPEGNTMSRLYVQGSIRSWIHYIDVRTDASTQKEHRELALKIAEVISKVFNFSELK
jgi:thymidylate synthase (FAD)